MSEEETSLDELVALDAWEWLSGTLSLPDTHGRTWRLVGDQFQQESGRRIRTRCPPKEDLRPDFRDPCTKGGLLELARRAWKAPEESADYWVTDRTWTFLGRFRTGSEVQTLIAALRESP